MYKVRIRLDTIQDVNYLVDVAKSVSGRVIIEDADGHCVNAKSLLGAIYSMEFTELWCSSDKDIYTDISRIVVE